MAPVIASTGQTRSRLPPKWMQQASSKSAASTVKSTDRKTSLQDSPVRWSTHTLAADPNDTVRSRAESTTSTYVDTFAHRRKSRISDLTCVDHLEDLGSSRLTPSESLTSSINDLSLTLNNEDEYELQHQLHLPKPKHAPILDDADELHLRHEQDDDNVIDSDDDFDNDAVAHRIDRLMAATMEALEASNQLVLDTLSSRAKLAQLNAMEAALDSHLDAREAHLHRQIQAVNDMTEFVAKTSAELQRLTSPQTQAGRVPSGGASTTQLTALSDPAEVEVRGAAATGIVQALDRDATIGKTAAKRLERMLQTPTTPTSSPKSGATEQRRGNSSTRRAFSISNFASVASIAEEDQREHDDTLSTPDVASADDRANRTTTPSAFEPTDGTNTASDRRTSTPQKKRSVSHDSRVPGSMKLLTKLGGPTTTATSGFVPSPSVFTAPSLAVGTTATTTQVSQAGLSDAKSDSVAKNDRSDSRGSRKPSLRPSLMAALRQEPASASLRLSHASDASSRTAATARAHSNAVSGLPTYSGSASLKATANVSATSAAAESTLAALLGMPSAAASTSSRTETPSDSSYFDSAMEESISSTSPPTPGSVHAIHGVLATPWKPAAHDDHLSGADSRASQERPARRGSMQYSTILSPRASLSLSDRDRAQQLSSQLAELRAERVTWNPQSVGNAETETAGTSTSGSGAGGGGALRALQKLNEMSAAKIAGQGGTAGEEEGSGWYGGSKRVSLGLGLPSFSALRPSASRSTSSAAVFASATRPPSSTLHESTPETKPQGRMAPASAAEAGVEGADTSSSSLLAGGWRPWAWNGTSNGDNATLQK